MTLIEQSIPAALGLIFQADQDAREKAFVAAKRHSRFVRIFRIVLPVSVVIASLGIFVASGLYGDSQLAFSVGNIAVGDRGLTMNDARLTGVNDDNQFYEINADTAIQSLSDPNILILEGIKARILSNDDDQGWANLEALEGVYDRENERLKLNKDIRVRSSEGYDIRMDTADVDLGNGSVVTRDPVKIDMVNGTLRAQGMRIENSGEMLHFFDGVSLNFVPRKSGQPVSENVEESNE